MDNQYGQIPGVSLYRGALPQALFDRLLGAVRKIGSDQTKNNGSYTTTFWFDRYAVPSNVAEEAAMELLKLIGSPPECIGVEWWLGRLGHGKKLRFHFDRDLALQEKTGELVCPLLASVLYLNEYPSGPTVIVEQIPGPDGKSKIPENPVRSEAVDAIPNNYIVFPGNMRHGVIPDEEKLDRDPVRKDGSWERRLTLLVNYWHRKPLAPICNDYDGSVYPSLRDREFFGANRPELVSENV